MSIFAATTIKSDFPIFQANPELVYLDSAASSQKPQVVIDAEKKFYEEYYSNVHRGVYDLSVRATDAYEGAREKVRLFIHARSTKEIIFTKGATEAINLVASSLGKLLEKGDVIVLSDAEHHANLVPWLQLRDEKGIELRFIPVNETGKLAMDKLPELLDAKVKLVAISQMSNVLGTVNDIKEISRQAHAVGAFILVDAAQSIAHMPVDVQDLDADFLVFSGHKMLGPTGIGVLYARQAILETLPPYQVGGDMILEVAKDVVSWNELPWRFEAGTPNIAGAIGLGVAITYLERIGMKKIWKHEQELTRYGLAELKKVPGLTLLGPTASGPTRSAIFSFNLEGIHPHDAGSILDEQGIAVRVGHHCTMPLHHRFGLTSSIRASLYLYNTKDDIDALVRGIRRVQEIFTTPTAPSAVTPPHVRRG